MAANDSQPAETSGNAPVRVTDWQACYNSADGIIVLACTVTTDDSSATISSAGLILNNANGMSLGSCYVAFSGDSESATPSLNLPPGDLKVGDTIWGVVTGEAGGKHYFFEEQLTIVNC